MSHNRPSGVKLDPEVADAVPYSEYLSPYDDYLNGQPVSCCAQCIKPRNFAGILSCCCDETVFGVCNHGGCHGATA